MSIDPKIETNWISWMKEEHIPEVLATGCFESHKFLKLLNDRPDVEGPTYAIQYFAKSMAQIDHYLDVFAPKLRKDVEDRFIGQFAAFRTLLEEV